jgi:ketosteroid isomerase-like protein
MVCRRVWTAGLVVAATVISCTTLLGQTAASNAADGLEPVRDAAEHFLRVFDNLDWEAFRATWASDPTVFFPFDAVPERATGRTAVEAGFRRFFDEAKAARPGPPYLHLNPRELRVERYGDTGIVTFMLDAPGGRVARRTLVFVRENGAWKLAHLHASAAGPR